MARINVLPPLVSSRIAAGEIIERPQSVLRELLDNAIDAESTEIHVSLTGGGVDSLSVSDNGKGIEREDLPLLGNRHATSKISSLSDLYDISTMGFRGEALYSISAVSRLTIATCSRESGVRSTFIIDNGRREEITSSGPNVGTTITVENLFAEIPARRAFLKRNATEAQVCKNTLISKALAFPNIRFTLTIDGALKLDLPIVATLKERVMELYRLYSISSADVNELHSRESDYSLTIICTNQEVKRTDRKEIRIYVNKRPVEDYALQQAVIYGYGELLPGGSYPYAVVLIEDKNELVDFNIHPSKKEVKLRNGAEIHHSISTLLKTIERRIPELDSAKQLYLDELNSSTAELSRAQNLKQAPYSSVNINKDKIISYNTTTTPSSSSLEQAYSTYKGMDDDWLNKAKRLKEERDRRIQEEESRKEREKSDSSINKQDSIVYVGQAFKLFLIAEKEDELYLIDQHAAHERIIYDELLSQKTVQRLLLPIHLSPDVLTDSFLSEHSHVYTSLGIMLSRVGECEWEIDSIPAVCRGIEDKIVDQILSAKADEHELEAEIFAVIACKAAIKKGDSIDKWAAEAIIDKVFKMKEPCCPHGRTFLIKIKKEELMRMVGRTSFN